MNRQIERLRELNQEQIERLYQDVFGTEAGQIVLEDLKGRFFEYVPPSDMFNVGQQSVLIHIKNMVNPLPIENALPS